MKFLRRLFKQKIDIKILMDRKEKVLNLYAQAYKGKDTNRVNYLQGQMDLLEEIIRG